MSNSKSLIRFAQPFKKRIKRRPCGLPREWAANGYDYIGDSWTVHGNRLINIKGKRFWSLLVLYRDRTRSSRAYSYWICECDCGRRYSIRSDGLRYGKVVCCPTCTAKVNLLYKNIRDEKRSQEQIERATARKNALKMIRMDQSEEMETIYVPRNMTPTEKILEMRDTIGMKISEIANEMNMDPETVRMILLESKNIRQKEKNHIMAAIIEPPTPGKMNECIVTEPPPVEPERKRRFVISNSEEGMTPKQMREYLNSQNKEA